MQTHAQRSCQICNNTTTKNRQNQVTTVTRYYVLWFGLRTLGGSDESELLFSDVSGEFMSDFVVALRADGAVESESVLVEGEQVGSFDHLQDVNRSLLFRYVQ